MMDYQNKRKRSDAEIRERNREYKRRQREINALKFAEKQRDSADEIRQKAAMRRVTGSDLYAAKEVVREIMQEAANLGFKVGVAPDGDVLRPCITISESHENLTPENRLAVLNLIERLARNSEAVARDLLAKEHVNFNHAVLASAHAKHNIGGFCAVEIDAVSKKRTTYIDSHPVRLSTIRGMIRSDGTKVEYLQIAISPALALDLGISGAKKYGRIGFDFQERQIVIGVLNDGEIGSIFSVAGGSLGKDGGKFIRTRKPEWIQMFQPSERAVGGISIHGDFVSVSVIEGQVCAVITLSEMQMRRLQGLPYLHAEPCSMG